jgi:hypothetical protein
LEKELYMMLTQARFDLAHLTSRQGRMAGEKTSEEKYSKKPLYPLKNAY